MLIGWIFIFQYFVAFESEGIFTLSYNRDSVSQQKNSSNSRPDINFKDTEVECGDNYSSCIDYIACIKADFQGYISVASRHNNNDDTDQFD